MKKNLILIMAAFTIFTFATATSSHAFGGLGVATVILTAIFSAAVGVDTIVDEAPPQKQELRSEVKPLQETTSLSPGT